MDSFVRYFADANIGHITECILKNSSMKELSHDLEVYVRVYIFGTVQLTCQWLLGEFDSTADHLAELFEKAEEAAVARYNKLLVQKKDFENN